MFLIKKGRNTIAKDPKCHMSYFLLESLAFSLNMILLWSQQLALFIAACFIVTLHAEERLSNIVETYTGTLLTFYLCK